VIIAEADDNEVVARLALEIGVRAGLHTETLPAMAIGVLSEEESGDEGQGEARFAGLPSPSSEEWRLPGRGS
jgi:hypothetical protein